MEFLEKMNSAMEFLEERLDGDIDYGELARRIGCTEYHLSRMFPFLTGVSLSLYVRRRRMSRAAEDLRRPHQSVLEVAVRYGYSSVDSFRRAFHDVHGMSPSRAADSAASLKLYAKLTFQLSVKGATPMVYRLVEKEAFRIVGIQKRVRLIFEGPNPEIDQMWQSVTMDKIVRWKALSNTEPRGIVSGSTNFSEDRMSGRGTLDHVIGAATTEPASAGDDCLEVDAGTWAVFEAVGDFPRTLQTLWGRIYSEWLPASPYQVRQGPEMLWNEGPDTTKPDFRSEIWIPVVRT